MGKYHTCRLLLILSASPLSMSTCIGKHPHLHRNIAFSNSKGIVRSNDDRRWCGSKKSSALDSRWKKIPQRSFDSPLGWTSISASDALTMDSLSHGTWDESKILILSPKGQPVSLQIRDHQGVAASSCQDEGEIWGASQREAIEAACSGPVDLQDARDKDPSILSIASVNIAALQKMR